LYYTASSGSTGYITGWGLANDVYIVAAPGLPAMDAYSFGSQTRGTTASQTFAIYNVTSYTQTYTFSNTTGTLNSGDFTIDSSNCASSLVADSNESTFAPPDNYCSVTVTFKPTTPGFRSTALTITDSHGDQAVIPIVGKGQ
jgi:hypothetical protein